MRRTLAAIGYDWAPSRGRALPASLDTPWARLAAVLAVALVAHLALPAQVAGVLLNPMGASLGAAVVMGVRRTTCRPAWYLLATGVALYAIADIAGYLSLIGSVEQTASLLFLGSYGAFAAGFTAFAARTR